MQAKDENMQARRELENGTSGSALHKPTGTGKRPNGKKKKKDDGKKKTVAIAAGAGAVAVVGIGAAIVHSMNGTGSNSAKESANKRSSDTGLSFDSSDDDDTSSSSKDKDKDTLTDDDSLKSKKKSKSKSKSKKKSSSDDLDDLLDGGSSSSSSGSDDLSDILSGGSGTLSSIASQAKKAGAQAKSLAKSASGKSGSSSSSSANATGKKKASSDNGISDVINPGAKLTPLSNVKASAKSGSNSKNSAKNTDSGQKSQTNGSASNGSSSSSNGTTIVKPSTPSDNSSNSSSDSGKSDSSKGDSSKDNSNNSGTKDNSSDSSKDNSKDNTKDNTKDDSKKDDSSSDTTKTTKTVTYMTSDGDVVGTGTLTITTKGEKTTYKLDDSTMPEGYWVEDTSQVDGKHDFITVTKYDTNKTDNGNKLVSQKVVSFSLEDGTTIATGTIEKYTDAKTGKTYCLAYGLPLGFTVTSSDDVIDSYPDTITVKSDSEDGNTDSGYPADKIKAGSVKSVKVIDSDGKEVGTATLTKKDDGSVELSGLPEGYQVSDLVEGWSPQLYQWPDQVTVVKTNTTRHYAFEDHQVGDTKQVDLVLDGDENYNVIAEATITIVEKDGKKGVDITGIPEGYELSDKDTNGSKQLLEWPDVVWVKKTSSTNNGGSDSSNTDSGKTDGGKSDSNTGSKTKLDDITAGTSKNVDLVTSDGLSVGTGKMIKDADGTAHVENVPEGYTYDKAQLNDWPEKVTVKKNDGSKTYVSDGLEAGTERNVTFKLADGTVVGTGKIVKQQDGSVKPEGLDKQYKTANDEELKNWQENITVVKDENYKPTDDNKGNVGGTPTKPTGNQDKEESKEIKYIDESGNVVGTDTLTRKTTYTDGVQHVTVTQKTGKPIGYKLKDGESLDDYKDEYHVVRDESQKILKVGDTKTAKLVTEDGKEVGTLGMKVTGTHVGDDGKTYFDISSTTKMPEGWRLKDKKEMNDWKDTMTVVSDKALDPVTFNNITFTDAGGKKLATGSITVTKYESGRFKGKASWTGVDNNYEVVDYQPFYDAYGKIANSAPTTVVIQKKAS